MFTALSLPTIRLTMSSRRRGEDNMSLYDFAKKYQENQGSSDLVKKQNATEDKVLSTRLQYLKNQKVLTIKNLEKEIDLLRRRKMYGWDSSRKLSVSSHHFDRASLPVTPRRWTKHNFSPAKFVKREFLQSQPAFIATGQPSHLKTDERVVNNPPGNICEPKMPSCPSKQLNEKRETAVNDELHEQRNVVKVIAAVNIATETTSGTHDYKEKQHKYKSFLNPISTRKAIYPVGRDITSHQTNPLPSWSRYSHDKQNLSTSSMTRTPTPRAKAEELEKEEHCLNGSSLNLNTRGNPSRFHRSDNIRIKLDDTKFNPLLDLGGGLKDLRFKNLESVLIPH